MLGWLKGFRARGRLIGLSGWISVLSRYYLLVFFGGSCCTREGLRGGFGKSCDRGVYNLLCLLESPCALGP